MAEQEMVLTPMMKQYREAKADIPGDAILLFRLGDFYEMFFEDAARASALLDIVLTRRAGVPMCGFPYHALEMHLPKLLGAGVKVAIAEQLEDPKLAKGIVKRAVTRIITPGTIIDGTALSPSPARLARARSSSPRTSRTGRPTAARRSALLRHSPTSSGRTDRFSLPTFSVVSA